jgi:hypothetical protein
MLIKHLHASLCMYHHHPPSLNHKIIATTIINQQQPGNYLWSHAAKEISYICYASSLIIIAYIALIICKKAFAFFLRNINIASTILQSWSLLYSSANVSECWNLIFKVARLVESDQLKHHIEVSFAMVATDCMHACYTEVLRALNF